MATKKESKEEQGNNWMKGLLIFKYAKSAITDIVAKKVNIFKGTVLSKCAPTNCNNCTTNYIQRVHTKHGWTKRKKFCPNGVCDTICDEIINEDKMIPLWRNTDATQWCNNAWTIAQCFMPPNSNKATSPEDTDFTATMSVIANARFMDAIFKQTPCDLPNQVCPY